MALQSKQENTATLSNTVSTMTVLLGTTLLDTSRASVIWTVRSAQAVGQTSNYYIAVEIISTTQVRIVRGGSGGTMVVDFQVIEYTAASGVVVDRGNGTLSANPSNVLLPSRPQGNRYSRVGSTNTISLAIADCMLSHFITSNTNLQIQGNSPNGNITFYWETVYDPGASVHNHSGLATGTSLNVNIAGDNIDLNETFTVQSMHYGGSGGIDSDEYKGANITSNSNLNIYSFFGDSMNFKTQLIHNPANKVQRNDSTYTITPFAIVVGDPYDVANTFINLAVPNFYICPTNEATNNSQVFAHTALMNSSTTHTLQRFLNGDTTRVVSEIVEIDANPVGTTATEYYYRMNNRRR